ncbi:MAG: hypothetical protein F6J87_27165 [Spirulina sp. SIO3F2]|nr:hypothetical protein [Spirulina sp. SIO3F2]
MQVHNLSPRDTTQQSIDEAVLQAAIVAYFAANPPQALPPGAFIWFCGIAPPTGYLHLNGDGVLRADHALLDTAVYCGDEENAAAGSFYHFTDLSDPESSRDINGPYLKLLDVRSDHICGADDGRGVEPNHIIGSWHEDTMQGHYHAPGGTGSKQFIYNRGSGGIISLSFSGGSGDRTTVPVTAPTSDGVHGTPRIASRTQTRRVVLLPCIKT